jgi:hypothetical protein
MLVACTVGKYHAHDKGHGVQGDDGGLAHFLRSTLVLGSFKISKGTSKRLT